WSDRAPKQLQNLASCHTTPHNIRLRIIGSTNVDAVAGRFVVCTVVDGNDADAFDLNGQHDDLALELVADFLESTDVCHVTSPCWFRARDHRGLDGDRWPEAIDDAPARGPERSGGWRRRDFLGSRGMGEAQGKKVDPAPLRLSRSRRKPSYG